MDDQGQTSLDNTNDQSSSPFVNGLGTPPSDDDTTSKPSLSPFATNEDKSTPLATSPSSPSSDLTDIKQKALGQLAPLVKNLNQSPEDKFKTTMMMIQASDNQSLIQDAYDAAQQITDDKAKAQALLDIINEINYFSSQSN